MTPDERQLVLSLIVVPGRPVVDRRAEILQHFGSADGQALGSRLLDDAIVRHDAVDLEMALIVARAFGVTAAYLDRLIALCFDDWHRQHENIASELGRLASPAAVPALYRLGQWVPGYLAYDENRALARAAIWALGKIPGDEASDFLLRLSKSPERLVRREAEHQLQRRKEARNIQ